MPTSPLFRAVLVILATLAVVAIVAVSAPLLRVAELLALAFGGYLVWARRR